MARDVLLLPIVNLQLAEHLRGGLELLRIEVLLAHDQHVMLGKGAIEHGADFGVYRLGKIDPDYLGAGVAAQRGDGEGRHGRCLPGRFCVNAIAGAMTDQAGRAVRSRTGATHRATTAPGAN
jgi:hypothetical protein